MNMAQTSSQNNSQLELIHVPIESLKLAKWDVRRSGDTEEEYETMKNSILENGLIYPLTVAKMKDTEQDDDLIVIAGRRRLKVLKELRWKTVPVIVQFKDVTETELRRITFIENAHRRNLADIEKGFGIVAIYESAGYTGEQAISGAKSIDNYFGKNPDAKNMELKKTVLQLQKNLNHRPNTAKDNFIVDEKFLEVCKSIAHTPKYQYQLMQIVLQLDPDVLATARKAGLSRQKKLLLTKSKLRNHPTIQKNLIPKLQKVGPKQGEVLVNQKLRDIETGYIEPSSPASKEGNFVYSEQPSSEREKVQKEDTNKILDLPTAIELTIVKESNKMIYLLTGRAITKGERGYNEEIVNKNKERMYKIAKSFNKDLNRIDALIKYLKRHRFAIDSILEILEQEKGMTVKSNRK